MDDGAKGAHTRLVDIGAAIGAAINEAGSSRQALAEMLDVHPSQVTRMVNGQMPDIKLERIVEIEDALGMKRGALLRRGGYVEADSSVEAAIATDPALNAEAKRSLLYAYQAAVQVSGLQQ